MIQLNLTPTHHLLLSLLAGVAIGITISSITSSSSSSSSSRKFQPRRSRRRNNNNNNSNKKSRTGSLYGPAGVISLTTHGEDEDSEDDEEYDIVSAPSEDGENPHHHHHHHDHRVPNKQRLKEDIKVGLEGCIGNTPLMRIKSLSADLGCDVLAKCEFMNPCGSPKDRVALAIIQKAEKDGMIRPNQGDVVYEGTVGSTGISLTHICRAKGYLAHICMPSDQSTEKASLLRKLGAIVEAVPPASIVDSKQFVNLARSRARSFTSDTSTHSRGFFADQFESEANWHAHMHTTGPEIFSQCAGKLDAFVAGAGTGGTISGVARFLKPRVESGVKIILADPQGSGLLNKVKYGVMFNELTEREGTRRRQQVDTIVEGIGLNRVTANFEAGRPLIDDAMRVWDEEAAAMAKYLVERDGIFVGSSSAVNCVAAAKTIKAMGWEGSGKRVVTVLCDSGSRHLSKFWKEVGDVGGKTDMTLQQVLEAKEKSKGTMPTVKKGE